MLRLGFGSDRYMYRSARDAAAAAVPKAKNDVIYDHICIFNHIYTYFETP